MQFVIEFYPNAKQYWPSFDCKGSFPSITLKMSEKNGKSVFHGFTMDDAEAETFDKSQYENLIKDILSLINTKQSWL